MAQKVIECLHHYHRSKVTCYHTRPHESNSRSIAKTFMIFNCIAHTSCIYMCTYEETHTHIAQEYALHYTNIKYRNLSYANLMARTETIYHFLQEI